MDAHANHHPRPGCFDKTGDYRLLAEGDYRLGPNIGAQAIRHRRLDPDPGRGIDFPLIDRHGVNHCGHAVSARAQEHVWHAAYSAGGGYHGIER